MDDSTFEVWKGDKISFYENPKCQKYVKLKLWKSFLLIIERKYKWIYIKKKIAAESQTRKGKILEDECKSNNVEYMIKLKRKKKTKLDGRVKDEGGKWNVLGKKEVKTKLNTQSVSGR